MPILNSESWPDDARENAAERLRQRQLELLQQRKYSYGKARANREPKSVRVVSLIKTSLTKRRDD